MKDSNNSFCTFDQLQITQNEACITVNAGRRTIVANVKPSPVCVYEYYNPGDVLKDNRNMYHVYIPWYKYQSPAADFINKYWNIGNIIHYLMQDFKDLPQSSQIYIYIIIYDVANNPFLLYIRSHASITCDKCFL